MVIFLKKFGVTLISRQSGKEAYAAFLPTLQETGAGEEIEIDFEGVNTLAPSWADEFLTPLQKTYSGRLILWPSVNTSVVTTLSLLEKINGFVFNKKA